MPLTLSKNEKGMSIITVLVGVAITSLMALSVASISHNMSRVQETAKFRENAMSTTFLISSYLQDRAICKISLLGTGANGVNLNSLERNEGLRVNQIITSSSQTVFRVGNDEISRMVLEPIKGDSNLARVPLTHSRYLAQLRIEFNQRQGLLGGGISSRTIPVFLTLNTSNRAIECAASEGTDNIANQLEHLIGSPHTDPTNCRGQYYPIAAGTNPTSSEGLTPVDPKTRFQLLSKSPPAFRALRSPASMHNYSSDPAIRGPISDDGQGEIRQIDGDSYYVTPTIANGWKHGGTCNGSSYECAAGRVVRNENSECGDGGDGRGR